VLDIRAEEDRLWINMHPPDRESGWGMFLTAMKLRPPCWRPRIVSRRRTSRHVIQ
jgi:hypothetical protein